MGRGEKKQKSLLKEANDSIRKAIKLLSGLSLFTEQTQLVIRGTIIEPGFDDQFYYSKTIEEFYSLNSSKFVIRLIDNSFFTFYLLTNEDGKLEKFSFGFCSCPFIDDFLIESDCDLNYAIPNCENLKSGEIRNALLANYFMNVCKNDYSLVNSIVNLMNNPIYLRCDFDSKNISLEHPEYHLTINFIKDSRFKIDQPITFYNFVIFVLDFVYGKKVINDQFLRL